MRRLGLLALLALGALGCKGAPGAPGGPVLPPADATATAPPEPITAVEARDWPDPAPRAPLAPPVSARLTVRATDMDSVAQDGPGPYDIERTAKVTFVVDYAGLLPDGAIHAQQINLVTANGGLYQSLRSGVAATAASVQSQVDLPVAGTKISEYSLAGTWTVAVHLDDGPTTLVSGSFQLK